MKLKINSQINTGLIFKRLLNYGYDRVEEIIKPGDIAIKGGNISIFSVNFANPARIELFSNTIERIYFFDSENGKKIKEVKEISIEKNILSLKDEAKINPGDYVVHEDHGIGLFSNLGFKKVQGKNELYIFIQYLNNDYLYVPVKLIDKISSYIGVGRVKPRLNRLGSQTWKKSYKKTYDNIIMFARQLIKLYAERTIIFKKPWKIDLGWEKEVEKTFGYKETKDQKEAIVNLYEDLRSKRPVDRLICGDVGFGKTEVAIRAITQACANGYQVAFVTPTTILAEQHYITLKKRFSALPITVGHISRLVNKNDSGKVIEKNKNGQIDVLVGTHALLQERIMFKNLGLLIIDEEQKFGVKDKEKLKDKRHEVSVLSLTATPIPRTLFMALSGLRNISQIYTPPSGRKEIETKVEVFDEKIIQYYIEREMKRGGQIYYLHNEVATIEGKRNKIQKQFPKLNIAVAHGQMSEIVLAKTMSDFVDGKIDILVCSTIIENGIDLSNVNTLIVDHADKFGLSQLYQIRGRVGRSKKKAYALFTYLKKEVTNNAFKRLRALIEYTELGSGYNIAIKDLEIRGGGNILGREQHGNMEAVGLVLYSKMLTKAVEKIKLDQSN